MKSTTHYSLNWLALAVIAIGFMGLFAVEVALARTPFFQQYFTSPDFFYRALCIHVIFAMVIWLLVFNVCIWHTFVPVERTRTSKLSLWLVVASIVLFALVGFFGIGEPYLNNYIPIVDHPLFWVGLISFTVAYLLELFRFSGKTRLLYGGNTEQQLLSFSFILSFVFIGSSIISFVNTEQLTDLKLYFERIFWVPGHVQQFLNACIVLLCWHYLVRRSNNKNGEGMKNNAWLKVANAVLLLFTFPMLAGLFTDPLTPSFRFITALSYGLGLGVPILIHSVYLMRRVRLDNFAGFTFFLSLLLYYAGVLIAYGGMKSDLRITAHYHGVVTSLTVALMGITFFILKEKKALRFEKIAKWQPAIYTFGMFLVIAGLFLAGYYGAPRKTFGFNWIFNNNVLNYLNLLGIGAGISILGGFLFVVYAARSILPKSTLKIPVAVLLLATLMLSFKPPDEESFLGKKIADIEVFDETGSKFRLYELMGTTPVLLSPIYTSCPHSCSLITANLKEAVEQTDGLGSDYTVLTFSFDHSDVPKDLQEFIERWKLDGTSWKVVSAQKEDIEDLLASLDFEIEKIETTGEYAHPNLAVIVTPEKRISRYVHGILPAKETLEIGVLEARNEETSFSFFDELYLNCFQYDPATGSYLVDWPFVIELFAGITVIGSLLVYLVGKPLINLI